MTPLEAGAEMQRLSALLDKGIEALRQSAREYAEAEHDYRKAKAEAWLLAPENVVPAREAWVNDYTKEQRRRRDIAEGLRQAALEAVRSRRAQVSSLQTLLNAHKEEAAFARSGPQ